MKIQCACGTKYAFDVTPEMAQNPVQLICQECGADISSQVNELIRQELEAKALEDAVTTKLPPSMPSGPPRIRVAATAPAPAAATPEMPVCLKHPPHRTTHKCLVCQKPICPECMRLFGYVCSPLCRERAEQRGMKIPVFAGERSRVEAREWRKTGLITGVVAAVALGLVGLYLWYIFVGCLPKPYYSTRFPEGMLSGESFLAGENQVVYLHGVELGRYDIKKKEKVWHREVADEKTFEAAHPGMTGDLAKRFFKMLAAEYRLKVSGKNIWVVMPEKLQSFDWDTGEPKKEVALTGAGQPILQKDQLLLVENEPGNRTITHISFADGQTRVEKVNDLLASGQPARGTTPVSTEQPLAGLALKPGGKASTTPLDPAQVAEKVSHLTAPARIALPALLANAIHQQQLEDAMAENGAPPGALPTSANAAVSEDYSLIPLEDGCLQFSVRLLERRIVTRDAMKAKPAKSALEGARATDTRAVANELLNEMQRDRGGDKVTEDQSRYQVTLRRSDDTVKSEWAGEVTGLPGVIPLSSVNVLAAGNTIKVFDHANKKLWEATLAFNVALNAFDAFGGGDTEGMSTGAGPCVERGDTLYVADQGVLSAFDLKTGEARWRLPSVGITGIFFDTDGMIYVNTATASLDSIKYSRQIDIGNKVDSVIMKINPRSGKTLWSRKSTGNLNYISGKYLYVVSRFGGDFDENGEAVGGLPGLERPAYVIIMRLNPKNGKVMWSYQEDRCPLDVKFHDNTIQLVFRKGVEGLKFYTF